MSFIHFFFKKINMMSYSKFSIALDKHIEFPDYIYTPGNIVIVSPDVTLPIEFIEMFASSCQCGEYFFFETFSENSVGNKSDEKNVVYLII